MPAPSIRGSYYSISPLEDWLPSVLASSLAWCFCAVHAAPIDGKVTSGSGSVSQSGTTTTITQSSQNLSMTWKSFNIGSSETVNFVQPNSNAIAVNRILDTNGTQILGSLNANGKVYLINPNGILFGSGAQINVGSLVASTLDLSDSSLGSNERSFSGSGVGSVINQGNITAADGGYVVFLGNTVRNEGVVRARLGTIAMGAGNAVTLTFQDNQLLHLQVDQSVLNSLAQNQGLLQADGGTVLMSAGAKDSMLASVVNNTGIIQARTVENRNGTIVLLGGMEAGTTEVGGTLDASAADGGNGGFIETSAAKIKVADGTKISTLATHGDSGTWLIDPTDFTVAASGGDITGATLSSNLGGGNVTIQSTTGASGTAGNININDAVSWGANTTLSLNAQNNINVNANITATGASGKLALLYGQSAVASGNTSDYSIAAGKSISLQAGSNFSTKLGSDGTVKTYTVVNTIAALQGIGSALTGNYVLGSDLDNNNAAFTPIGTAGGASAFSGTFSGLGHTISNLNINRGSTAITGLFGDVNGGTVRDVGLINGSVTSTSISIGALVGVLEGNGVVKNSYARGVSVSTTNTGTTVGVGGLVGLAQNATISNSYATGSVTGSGSSYVGGLVGVIAKNSSVTISNSYATGAVSGANQVGGLVGGQASGNSVSAYSVSISNSYATGAVTATGSQAGGLVGAFFSTTSTTDASTSLTNSFASGSVTASGSNVGGLVGQWTNTGTLSNSYSTGAVQGADYVGGLIGLVSAAGTIEKSYTTSSVNGTSGTTYAGGFVGGVTAAATVRNSFSAGTVTGSGSNIGGFIGRRTAASNGLFSNLYWDQTTSTQSGPVGSGNGAGFTTKTAAQLKSASTLSAIGWDISNVGGSSAVWRIYDGQTSPLLRSFLTSMTVAGNGTAVYDGNTNVTSELGSTYTSNSNLLNTASLSMIASSKDVGTHTVTTSGNLYSTQLGYDISYATGSVTITPATVTVSGASAANKTYDGTTSASVSGGTLSGLVGSETLTLTQSGSFADKNAGNGKTVNTSFAIADGSNGGLASNYQLASSSGSTTANITAATVTVSGATAANKTYDGTTSASVSGGTLSGLVGSETLTLTQSGSFTDKNAGNGKTVNTSFAIADGSNGGLASNYQLASSSGTSTANITPASLVVSGISAQNKVYDATTSATLSGTASVTPLGADVVSVVGTGVGHFLDKNVGTAKSVAVTGYSLVGADAGNYTVVQPTGVTADISKAPLLVNGVTAADKVYDATTTAILSGGAVTALGTDALSLNTTGATGQFVNANAGLNKNVITTGYVLTGADANNYDLQQPSSVTANISRATVTVSGATAQDKTYDGTTTAIVTGGSLSGLVGAETLSLTQTGNFNDPNPGNGKTVTQSFSLGDGSNGGLASNYQLANTTSTTTASILALPDTTSPTSTSTDVGNLSELAKSAIFNPAPTSPNLQIVEHSTEAMASSDSQNSAREIPQAKTVVTTASTSGPVLLIRDGGVNLHGDLQLVLAP
ncbi:filamentous hemagglutinin N-terminal domain-containing protein [Curvibacter sp. CHRR-16]|uniref:beta strand repeat-containing protein n=1 Tax=Curvibacter sp. CHRR-16 TaxID=2835872 RepID=UPI001BD92581|nr:YDG domain-containing protein [Curvibacter sp. CHRR-16]MBT0571085.1 filamentous hemagglutinin N-terminal domain-containing protein [Curvibacter sp. CHRR-16]